MEIGERERDRRVRGRETDRREGEGARDGVGPGENPRDPGAQRSPILRWVMPANQRRLPAV
jgi:hypothetical protein